MKPHGLDFDGSDPAARSQLTRAALVYLVTAVVVTLIAAFVGRFAVPSGHERTFYEGEGFAGEPLLRDTTSQIDLTFVEQSPELPQRFSSVRWRGYWFLPRRGESNPGPADYESDGASGRVALLWTERCSPFLTGQPGE